MLGGEREGGGDSKGRKGLGMGWREVFLRKVREELVGGFFWSYVLG